MNDAPLIRLCGIYENVSKSGEQYFVGYAGGAKLLLLRNKKAGEGEAPWTLLVTARPEKGAAKPAGASQPAAEAQQPYPQHRSAQPRQAQPAVDPAFDDEIGF